MGASLSNFAECHPSPLNVNQLPHTIEDLEKKPIATCKKGWRFIEATKLKVVLTIQDSPPEEYYMEDGHYFAFWLQPRLEALYKHNPYTLEVETDQKSDLTTVTVSADDDTGGLCAFIRANTYAFEDMISFLEQRKKELETDQADSEQQPSNDQVANNITDSTGSGDTKLGFRTDFNLMPSDDGNGKKLRPLLDLLQLSVKQLQPTEQAKARDMWNTCVAKFNNGSSHDSKTLLEILKVNNPFNLFKGKLNGKTLPSMEVSPFWRAIPEEGIGCKTNIQKSIKDATNAVDLPSTKKRKESQKDAKTDGKKPKKDNCKHDDVYLAATGQRSAASDEEDAYVPDGG